MSVRFVTSSLLRCLQSGRSHEDHEHSCLNFLPYFVYETELKIHFAAINIPEIDKHILPDCKKIDSIKNDRRTKSVKKAPKVRYGKKMRRTPNPQEMYSQKQQNFPLESNRLSDVRLSQYKESCIVVKTI